MAHKITFRERGEGEPLILLHGYGGSVLHWDAVAENLKDRFRVVVPNMSHLYMSSDKLLFSVQVETLADFIRAHFPQRKVYVAGLSYGGALAWALSLQHPDLVERLVLINPLLPNPVAAFSLPELRYFFSLPLGVKPLYLLLSTPVGRAFLKRAALIFRDERAQGQVPIESLKGRKLQFVAHMIHHFSWILRTADWDYWRAKMPLSRVLSLLIYDVEDLLFRREHYADFSRSFPFARIVELRGAGHLAIKNHPEGVAAAISDFLRDADVKSA